MVFWKPLLKTEASQENPLKTFYYNNNATKEVKTSKNDLINEFTLCFNVMVLHTIKL